MKKLITLVALLLFCSAFSFSANGTKASAISVSAIRKQCSTPAKAKKHMKRISFKTWDISNGKKYTRTRSILVHEQVASKFKKAFDKIYNGKEKFPIHDVGGYNWRGSTKSLHSLGLAVDINSNENYMVVKGKVRCGSFWKPGKSPFSIKKNGDVMRAMRANGFKQCIWGSLKDYMHFSVQGL